MLLTQVARSDGSPAQLHPEKQFYKTTPCHASDMGPDRHTHSDAQAHSPVRYTAAVAGGRIGGAAGGAGEAGGALAAQGL